MRFEENPIHPEFELYEYYIQILDDINLEKEIRVHGAIAHLDSTKAGLITLASEAKIYLLQAIQKGSVEIENPYIIPKNFFLPFDSP